ncbi:MAG: prepilin-type N-terminal cleavage/methylation domain-containing protein [Pseudomonadota bacterium]
MTRAAPARRQSDTGFTIIEMLVVLALFGILAGAVVLALPGDRTSARAGVAAASWVSALQRAMDTVLATDTSFGVRYRDDALTLVERDNAGRWQPHSNPDLAAVKLFPDQVRSSDQADPPEVYAVSVALIPVNGTTFFARFGKGALGVSVRFDGATVRVIEGEHETNEAKR